MEGLFMLNITNGDYFNNYFKDNIDACALPFREAMMQGCATKKIFSKEFISARAISLGVQENEYLKNCADLLLAIKDLKDEGQIDLWFGADTFCQLNLLTLLAYLEQVSFKGKVFLHTIDDETFEIIGKKTQVKLGVYNQIYNDVILNKRTPKDYGALSKRGVDLYFDYLSTSGFLAKIVKDNANLTKKEIVVKLLQSSKDYGLSDVLAGELIDRVLG